MSQHDESDNSNFPQNELKWTHRWRESEKVSKVFLIYTDNNNGGGTMSNGNNHYNNNSNLNKIITIRIDYKQTKNKVKYYL